MVEVHLTDDFEVTASDSGMFVVVKGVEVYAEDKSQLKDRTLLMTPSKADKLVEQIEQLEDLTRYDE